MQQLLPPSLGDDVAVERGDGSGARRKTAPTNAEVEAEKRAKEDFEELQALAEQLEDELKNKTVVERESADVARAIQESAHEKFKGARAKAVREFGDRLGELAKAKTVKEAKDAADAADDADELLHKLEREESHAAEIGRASCRERV